jgi:hypothetical protein
MENFDNLFEQQSVADGNSLWTERHGRSRNGSSGRKLYVLIAEMSEKTLADPSALSDYLNMQVRLGRPALPIRCLVVAQSPMRQFIANYDDWPEARA